MKIKNVTGTKNKKTKQNKTKSKPKAGSLINVWPDHSGKTERAAGREKDTNY